MISHEPRLGEFALIADVFAPLARGASGAYGLKDDAATFDVPEGQELVLTTDALVETVHFLSEDPPDLIARKALRVNLSDLAAKGAVPAGYLLALSLPSKIDNRWIRRFADGLALDQREFGIILFGGDTTATPGPLTLAITAFGLVPRGATLRRGGAKPGDGVYVTGTIGDAGAGLAVLRTSPASIAGEARDRLIARYRLPEPRVRFGPQLIGLASAALDVSDGLVADIRHIADVSGVKIRIEAERVPLSPALQTLWGDGEQAVSRAATSGDDYEIAFTAPPSAETALIARAKETGTALKKIGAVEAGQGVVLEGADGKPLPIEKPGFVHF